jgi:hypothetical protein
MHPWRVSAVAFQTANDRDGTTLESVQLACWPLVVLPPHEVRLDCGQMVRAAGLGEGTGWGCTIHGPLNYVAGVGLAAQRPCWAGGPAGPFWFQVSGFCPAGQVVALTTRRAPVEL